MYKLARTSFATVALLAALTTVACKSNEHGSAASSGQAAVETFIRTGKFEHSCAMCGDKIGVCHKSGS